MKNSDNMHLLRSLLKKNAFFLFLLFASGCFVSCGNEDVKPHHPVKAYTKEKLMEANKADSRREADDIRAFIKHHQWEMQESGTGLQYMFLGHSPKGDSAKTGMEAKVSYKVYLLNGTLCYSSDKDGPKTFKIGEDHVESGIHEVVLRMKTGDSMRFVLPSNLAHGLLGDGDKIPPRSPVMYEMELISLR
jgi:FKBP-type peptidyl-prolyl cis-trans isomerase FkpA